MFFDTLTLGAVETTPARLGFSRSGDTLVLWWPAAGMGWQLLLTSTSPTATTWNAMTNAMVLTNGYRTYTTRATNFSGFFRLRRQ